MEKSIQSKVWIRGPGFLLKPESEWPKQLEEKGLSTEEDPEIKTCARVIVTSAQESQDVVLLLVMATTKESSRMVSQTKEDTDSTEKQEKRDQGDHQSEREKP